MFEILIAVAIFGMITAMALPFLITCMREFDFTTNRIALNHDVRYLTQRLMKEGRAAGQYIVYDKFDSGSGSRTAMNSGQSGDFVVFLKMDANGVNVVQSIGYYRNSDDNTIRRFAVSELGNSPVPTAIPAASTKNSHPIVVEFARDLVADKLLFLNLNGNGVVINGEIRNDGRNTTNGSQNRPAISTYNFTITPRG